MVDIKTVFIAILIIILLYVVVNYFLKTSKKLSSLSDAKERQVISSSSIPNSNTNQYTYSTWLYVDDWNYRFGEEKTVLTRKNRSDTFGNPSIHLGAMENNLIVNIACHPSSSSGGTDISANVNEPIQHSCTIRNIPLQKWTNVIISVYGRTLDVYLDGKLVRTCVLPGVPMTNPDADVLITPSGGFSGWTSKVEYWSNASSPQEAYNIYSSGYGQNMLMNLLNKFRIKISYLRDNREQASFEI
jgi:hypothetical protein